MSNFFRKIPQLLVVFVLMSVVYIGPVSAAESDSPASPPDVGFPVSDSADGSDLDADGGYSGSGGFGGYSSITCSGSEVTVSIEEHDTLLVASVSPDTPEVSDHYVSPYAEPETPALVDTIRSLFGPYTPRTQTVTTFYDGQPISIDEQVIPGLAGLDYEWIAGVVLFALIVYCLFRILGGVLKNG